MCAVRAIIASVQMEIICVTAMDNFNVCKDAVPYVTNCAPDMPARTAYTNGLRLSLILSRAHIYICTTASTASVMIFFRNVNCSRSSGVGSSCGTARMAHMIPAMADVR